MGRPRCRRPAGVLARHGLRARSPAGGIVRLQHLPVPPVRPDRRLRHLRPGVVADRPRPSRPRQHGPDPELSVLAEPLRTGHVAHRPRRPGVAPRHPTAVAPGCGHGGDRVDRHGVGGGTVRGPRGPAPFGGGECRPGVPGGQSVVVSGRLVRRALRDARSSLRAVVRLLVVEGPGSDCGDRHADRAPLRRCDRHRPGVRGGGRRDLPPGAQDVRVGSARDRHRDVPRVGGAGHPPERQSQQRCCTRPMP